MQKEVLQTETEDIQELNVEECMYFNYLIGLFCVPRLRLWILININPNNSATFEEGIIIDVHWHLDLKCII